jgi:AcrR family transcriptional regulator
MNTKPQSKAKNGRGSGGAAETRQALVRAALRLFADKGFDGASTREIAAEANANIGSIAYHFGGKDQLYQACAEHIVETMGRIAGEALPAGAAEGKLAAPPAEKQLAKALSRVVHFLVAQEEAGEIVQFLLRELQHPTEALDTIYAGIFEPVHRRACGLWQEATGEKAESERTRLTVFTLIGQVVYFRIGREVVRRRMGWDAIGAAEADRIAEVIGANFAAVLAARQGEGR